MRDLGRETRSGGGIAVSETTVLCRLDEDAIRPWRHRCWLFPCGPDFARKAGRVLGLYHRTWQGVPLRDDDFVVSAAEETSIQVRARTIAPCPPAGPAEQGRARVQTLRGLGLPSRPRCPPFQAVGPQLLPCKLRR